MRTSPRLFAAAVALLVAACARPHSSALALDTTDSHADAHEAVTKASASFEAQGDRSARKPLAASRYKITVITPDPGCDLPDWLIESAPFAPPNISMNGEGDVGFIQHGTADSCGAEDGKVPTGTIRTIGTGKTSIVYTTRGLNYSVVVVDASGKRKTLRAVPRLDDRPVLADQFAISDVRLANDGTTFITLAAGSNVQSEWLYSWDGTEWIRRDIPFPQRYGGPRNERIGAVISPERIAVNANYKDATEFDYAAHDKDPSYYEDQSALVLSGAVEPLGPGDVTSMRGRFSVGYAAPYGWCTQGGGPTAILWDGTAKKELGNGIAFGVDVNGDVVGDDRKPDNSPLPDELVAGCIDQAHPTLWRAGRSIELSKLRGAALSIRDGLIVGTVGVHTLGPEKRGNVVVAVTGGRAFIARAYASTQGIQYLDELVGGDWVISTAFAIADSGRILAVGHPRGSLKEELLILDPKVASR